MLMQFKMSQHYQQPDCRFCQIASRQIEDYLIWQDSAFSLLLDYYPARRGHCMLIPNWHAQSIYDLTDEQTSRLFNTAKRISFSLMQYTGARRIGMLIKGFAVPHAHLHLIPINSEGQNLEEKVSVTSKEELRRIQLGLQEQLNKLC